MWLFGPICGAFIQPVLGRLSDRSRHAWGMRKPFILCGASCVTACLLALACIEDLTGDHVGVGFRPKTAYGTAKTETSHLATQALAVVCVCVVTFAIQAFQAGVRALIVDVCPLEQQVSASAWSARWNGLGSVCLTLVGYADARWTLFSGEGNAKFKTLAAVVAVSVAVTVGLVCFLIPDRPSESGLEDCNNESLLGVCRSVWSVKQLRQNWESLPPVSLQVCKIQLVAWLGWFPVLYYTSTSVLPLSNREHVS